MEEFTKLLRAVRFVLYLFASVVILYLLMLIVVAILNLLWRCWLHFIWLWPL